jgi:hypothetical protein
VDRKWKMMIMKWEMMKYKENEKWKALKIKVEVEINLI